MLFPQVCGIARITISLRARRGRFLQNFCPEARRQRDEADETTTNDQDRVQHLRPHGMFVAELFVATAIQEHDMPRGDKSSYTGKQKRQAEHIEDSYKKRGVSSKTAAKRAWATVNKETGGGKKGGAKKKTAKKAAKKSSGRKKTASKKK
jgi:hypothetical protein